MSTSTVSALARSLASARNYVYETNMGDYSMASITRAQNGLAEAKREVRAAGLDADAIVHWDNTKGCFVPTEH